MLTLFWSTHKSVVNDKHVKKLIFFRNVKQTLPSSPEYFSIFLQNTTEQATPTSHAMPSHPIPFPSSQNFIFVLVVLILILRSKPIRSNLPFLFPYRILPFSALSSHTLNPPVITLWLPHIPAEMLTRTRWLAITQLNILILYSYLSKPYRGLPGLPSSQLNVLRSAALIGSWSHRAVE